MVDLVIAILAVWRASHLLQAEDGPWNLSVRLRRAAGTGAVGRMMDCFYCLSLWVAVPAAALQASNMGEAVMLWLAISGGASVVQRFLPPEAHFVEDAWDGISGEET